MLCVETLRPDIAQTATDSRFPGASAFPAHLWATHCIIVCKERLAGCSKVGYAFASIDCLEFVLRRSLTIHHRLPVH